MSRNALRPDRFISIIVKSFVVPSVQQATPDGSKRSTALDIAAFAFGRLPGGFGLAKILGRNYSLRCVVFHDIRQSESPFTKGMGVTISPSNFESVLHFIAAYYHPVGLTDVLEGRRRTDRALLVTLDDGYASVMKWALPVFKRLGIPATLFLNSAFLDNRWLSPDHLVCYVVNTCGMDTINHAVQSVLGKDAVALPTMTDVFRKLFPRISLSQRAEFLETLRGLAGVDDAQLAAVERVYLTSKEVRALADEGFEIGNHTKSHIHCRNLGSIGRYEEIDDNKKVLENISGKPVRSFSVPYGSSLDLSHEFGVYLRQSGHEGVFLSEGTSNSWHGCGAIIDRVGVRGTSDQTNFADLEILPRLRSIRKGLRRSR